MYYLLFRVMPFFIKIYVIKPNDYSALDKPLLLKLLIMYDSYIYRETLSTNYFILMMILNSY